MMRIRCKHVNERHRVPPVGALARWLAMLLIAALGAPVWVGAQAAIAVRDFEPAGYLFRLDDQLVADAEIFQSRVAGSFLVLTSRLSAPLLVRLRDAQVVSVNLMKVNRNQDGTVELLPEATLESHGTFRVTADREGVAFEVDGRTAELREKPPLLGHTDIEGLAEHSPEYRRTATGYRPSDPILDKLRGHTDSVRVAVYFGTWCGFCKEMMPRIMKVAEQLQGSKVQIDFYGLPRGINSDPEARRVGITGVPTGVVYVSGKEVGRISGNAWKVPELAINNLLIQ